MNPVYINRINFGFFESAASSLMAFFKSYVRKCFKLILIDEKVSSLEEYNILT